MTDASGGKPTPELIRRQQAVAFILKKYKSASCDFVRADCVRMLRTLLVKLGYSRLPRLPRYDTLAGAVRALRERGWNSTPELIDEILPGRRIAPAEMWLGDVAVAPDESGLGAIWVAIGGGRMLGWIDGSDKAAVIEPLTIEAAWRV